MCVSLAISDMADKQSYRKQNLTTLADRPPFHDEDLVCVCSSSLAPTYITEPLEPHQTRSLLKPDPRPPVPLIIL